MLNFNPRSRVGNDGNIQADAGSLSISIHVPAWGTTVFCSGRSISCAISIHVPAWGTTKYLFIMYGIVKISIHVPAWGTTDLCPDALGWGLISIHVPAWGTTLDIWFNEIFFRFQSTFPRGERRHSNYSVFKSSGISIHVPAWGTTVKDCSPQNTNVISIHVPAWGTTFYDFELESQDYISIHVPAWGTTGKTENLCTYICHFNPRSRVGNDKMYIGTFWLIEFQSTFPRGERQYSSKHE